MNKPIIMKTIVIVSFFFCISDAAPAKDTTVVKLTNMAVLDLDPRGGLSPDELLSISDRLRGELINTGKYTIIERGQMDAILKEQGFQQSGACSEATCIVEVGQLLAVHKMVGGSIGKVGKAYSINLKIIDVATGKIERQVANDIKCSKEELIATHIRNVARIMAGLDKQHKVIVGKWFFWAPITVGVAGGAAALGMFLNTGTKPNDQTRTLEMEIPLQ
jgi:hypothetical protein